MTDDPNTPEGEPMVAQTPGDSSQMPEKPRRFTPEELLAGMTPGEKSEFQDDWPVGEELI